MINYLVDRLKDLICKQENENSYVDAVRFLMQVDNLMICPIKLKQIKNTYSFFQKPISCNQIQMLDFQTIIKSRRLDLHNGYAGVALSLIAKQDRTHQGWIQLL